MRTLEPVFYREIRPADGQRIDEVIRIAHNLGYEMIPFNGWDNQDIGAPGNRGPHYDEVVINRKRCGEIQDAAIVHMAEGDDWPHIIYTVE